MRKKSNLFLGKFYAYKPVLLGDGNWSIAKCMKSLADHIHSEAPVIFNGMAHSHPNQEIYLCGGISEIIYNVFFGPEITSVPECFKLKLSKKIGTSATLTSHSELDVWKKDSFAMIYHNEYLYSIGGMDHFLFGDKLEVGCGYEPDYKYAHTNLNVNAMPLTGVNASTYWEMFPDVKQELAMTCAVTVNDQFIYLIGGFHEFVGTESVSQGMVGI